MSKRFNLKSTIFLLFFLEVLNVPLSSQMSKDLLTIATRLLWAPPAGTKVNKSSQGTQASGSLLKRAVTLLHSIYERDCRLQFCTEGHWLCHEISPDLVLMEMQLRVEHAHNVSEVFDERATEEEIGPNASGDVIMSPIGHHQRSRNVVSLLKFLPFVIPFETRVQIFRLLVSADDQLTGPSGFITHYRVNINRATLYQDAYSQVCLQ
jgi:hypothetical protein